MHTRMHVAQQTNKMSHRVFNVSWLCALLFLFFFPSWFSSWCFFPNARLSEFYHCDPWYLFRMMSDYADKNA